MKDLKREENLSKAMMESKLNIKELLKKGKLQLKLIVILTLLHSFLTTAHFGSSMG